MTRAIRAVGLALAFLMAGPAAAQDVIEGAEDLFSQPPEARPEGEDWFDDAAPAPEGDVTEEAAGRMAKAGGVLLRGLDKLTGEVRDFDVAVGATAALGRLQVSLAECRYPVTNPAGNAYAYLVIREAGGQAAEFSGWMVAQSPALNALEHPRYDVWVMRCNT